MNSSVGWPKTSANPSAFVLLGLVLLVIAFAAWRPTPAGVWHDDGVYMMVGKALADGEGLRYSGVVGAPPAAKFPPLYSGLLALLWLAFGEIGTVTLVAQMLNLAFMAGAGALLAWALHVRSGLPAAFAVGVGVVAFASADVLRFALIPLSEPLFLLLLMGALAAWAAPHTDDESFPGSGLIAGLMVLLVLTRSAAIAPMAGFAITLFFAGRVRRAIVMLGPAALVAAAWGIWAAAATSEIPAGMRDVLGSYSGWISQQALGDPVGFSARLPGHLAYVGGRIATLLTPGLPGAAAVPILVVLVPLAAIGVRGMYRRFPPFVWTGVAYLCLLLLWPYVDGRLVAPLHPFVVTFVLVGAFDAARLLPKRRVSLTVGAAVALWVGAYVVGTAGRIATGWPAAAYRVRTEQLAPALEALEQTATAEAVVGAPEFWPALHLHGGWTVIPSALFKPARTDDIEPVWGAPNEQLALWKSTGVSHLLLEKRGEIHGAALDSLEARCPGSVDLVSVLPPQMLVRTDWEACPS